MTDKVKAKIQELLPDMDWQKAERTDGMWEETITLAVVLRALEKNTVIYGDLPARMQLENVQKRYGEVAGHWNLRTDNYDQQSEETKQFIGSLLANQ